MTNTQKLIEQKMTNQTTGVYNMEGTNEFKYYQVRRVGSKCKYNAFYTWDSHHLALREAERLRGLNTQHDYWVEEVNFFGRNKAEQAIIDNLEAKACLSHS